MTQVVLLAGSSNKVSRSTALLQRAAISLAAHGIDSELVTVTNFSAQALLYGWKHVDDISDFLQLLARADGVIVATPVYKASFSGVLKLLIDLLPERAFAGKAVLPLAVGGSTAHMLALDYALRPVLGALKPNSVVDGAFAIDSQIQFEPDGAVRLDEELEQRLARSLSRFVDYLPRPRVPQLNPALLPERLALAQVSI
jgi:FMN reductase